MWSWLFFWAVYVGISWYFLHREFMITRLRTGTIGKKILIHHSCWILIDSLCWLCLGFMFYISKTYIITYCLNSQVFIDHYLSWFSFGWLDSDYFLWKILIMKFSRTSVCISSASSCHTAGPQCSFINIFFLPGVFNPSEIASNSLFISITPMCRDVTMVWMSWPSLPSFPRLQGVTTQTSHLSGGNYCCISIRTAQTIWRVLCF